MSPDNRGMGAIAPTPWKLFTALQLGATLLSAPAHAADPAPTVVIPQKEAPAAVPDETPSTFLVPKKPRNVVLPRRRATVTRNNWVYLIPSYNYLSFEQTGAAPLTFTSSSAQGGGIKVGHLFGPWALEGSFAMHKFDVDGIIDDERVRETYTSQRYAIELMRRIFSAIGPFRMNGHLRMGVESHSIPLVDAEENVPRMARLDVRGLSFGFVLSSYANQRTRFSFAAKWLPGLSLSHNLKAPANLSAGFNYDLSAGVQYLIDSNWNVGLFGNMLHSTANGTEDVASGARQSLEASANLASAQLQLGYQF